MAALAFRVDPYILNILFSSFIVDYLVEFSGDQRLTEGKLATAGIFSTYPPDFVSNASGFGDQV